MEYKKNNNHTFFSNYHFTKIKVLNPYLLKNFFTRWYCLKKIIHVCVRFKTYSIAKKLQKL